ncbi:MAG: hypothetical protein ABIT08_05735 [Bacteroidia bacterium]
MPSFLLDGTSDVRIDIFNALGQTVSVLLKKKMESLKQGIKFFPGQI